MTHRRLFPFAAIAALALVLAACQVTVTPGPTPPADADYEFTAGSDLGTPVGSISIPVGASRTIDVSVPSSLRGSDRRVVVEIDDNDTYALDMVMFESNGTTPHASTSGGAFFAPGLTGLGRGFLQVPELTGGIDAGSLRPSPQCQGPCIARVATDAVVRVRIDNATGTGALTVPVYAYVDDFLHVGEPGNDSIATADVVDSGNGASGMIELLGDRDFVSFPSTGLIAFSENSQGVEPYTYDANLRLRIVNSVLEPQVVLTPGEDFFVQSGWYGIVFSDPSDLRATVGGAHYVRYVDN